MFLLCLMTKMKNLFYAACFRDDEVRLPSLPMTQNGEVNRVKTRSELIKEIVSQLDMKI